MPTCGLHLMSTWAQKSPIRVSWVDDESAQRLIWPSWISSHHFRESECSFPGTSAYMRPSSNVNMRTEVSHQSELSRWWISAKAHMTVVNCESILLFQGVTTFCLCSKPQGNHKLASANWVAPLFSQVTCLESMLLVSFWICIRLYNIYI